MLRQPLANKYRPRNFSQLKGQDILVKVLSNAITSSKLANAYLVTGIRGVGKTTTARIVAKTLNCSNVTVEQDLPLPCEECTNCKSLNSFSHPDILEIDAASKTGVNDIREIIENVRYKPVLGKYKIYIIDEMHMLSNSAFNALLKTLEEPPEDVLFIFATTEAQKIPATIISRCQRFDLKRLSLQEIASNLSEIATKEDIKFEDESLNLLAKFSEGSVRDSISLLETVNLYKKHNETISVNLINQVLGIPEIDTSYNLMNYLIQGNSEEALNVVTELYKNGVDLESMMEELVLIANKIGKTLISEKFISSISLFEHEKDLLKKSKKVCDISKITNIWKILFGSLSDIRNSSHPIGVIEMAMLRCCHLSTLPSLDATIKQVMQNAQSASTQPKKEEKHSPTSFKEVVNLFYKKKELLLYKYLTECIRVTNFSENKIEADILKATPESTTQHIKTLLDEWTNKKWQIIFNKNISADNTKKNFKEEELDSIKANQVVQAVHDTFPGSKIAHVTKIKENQ